MPFKKSTISFLRERMVNECQKRKDVGLGLLFEVAGMLLRHSIIQGGPGFPCLSPTVFDYLFVLVM